jgi:hypothetical protein
MELGAKGAEATDRPMHYGVGVESERANVERKSRTMPQNDAFNAIKLPFPPQEYSCTWHIPRHNSDEQNGTVEAHGTLDLTTGRHPQGTFYGTLPIMRKKGASYFPQVYDHDCLIGKLSTGAHIVLVNGHHVFWIQNHGRADGAFAMISRKPFNPSHQRTYKCIELQLEGLDEIIDVSPTRVIIPDGRKQEKDPTWSITSNDDANWKWQHDETTMRLHFAEKIRPDPYNFATAFAPILQIDIDDPLNIVEWWQQWIIPLTELFAALIGHTPDIMYVLAKECGSDEQGSKDQLFRYDITQQPLVPDLERIRKSKAAVKVQEDDVDLLAILLTWQALLKSHHPLIEMYDSVAFSADQHPRSRYLLLIQTLEGLHGFEHRNEQDARRKEHKSKRASFLQHMKESGIMTKEGKEFLAENLLRNPMYGLEQKLIDTFETLPVDIRDELNGTALIKHARDLENKPSMRIEAVLAFVRNKLSHGTTNFDPGELDTVAKVLDRAVRSELLRVLGAPKVCRTRLLENGEA